MVILEHGNKILHALNDKEVKQELRPYMGLSQIGDPCHRALQYNHYWAFRDTITTRVKRLFDTGHHAEDVMIEDLATVGIIVYASQDELVGFAGHWKGHVDGKAFVQKNTIADSEQVPASEFLVEFKTHNDKSFKDICKNAVQKSKPGHYAQMQAYMMYSGYEMCLYMAMNKNTSEYYIEWVPIDEEYCKEAKRKEAEIIMSDVLLPRVGNNSKSWFQCKFCSAKSVCFGDAKIEKTCRSCQHVDVQNNGKWSCSISNKVLSVDEQRRACPSYKLAEMFDD